MKHFLFLIPLVVIAAAFRISNKSSYQSANRSINKHPETSSKLKFAPGDMAYVLAERGLTLREAPGVKSKKTKVINHCDSVKIIGYDESPQAYQVNEFKGFDIHGYWVKVAANADTGYVFDGYLSSWKCIVGENARDGKTGLCHYLKDKFNISKETKRVLREWKKSSHLDYVRNQYLELYNGISCKVDANKGSIETILIVPDTLITKEDAFILFSNKYEKSKYDEFFIQKSIDIKDSNDYNYKPIGGVVTLHLDLRSIYIYQKGDNIVIIERVSII